MPKSLGVLERDWKAVFVRETRAKGFDVFCVEKSTPRGFFDIIIADNRFQGRGRVLFLEAKKVGGRLREAQKIWRHRFGHSGQNIAYAYSLEEAREALKKFMEEPITRERHHL